MRVKTIEAARGRWYGILVHFGLSEKQLSGKHCPCPICDGIDRFRFDNKDGSGSYFCNGCGAGYGMDLVQKVTGLPFKDAAKAVDQLIGKVDPEPVRQEKSSEEIRAQIKKILAGTNRNDATGYLNSRGIQSQPNVVFHPSLEYWHEKKLIGTYPAMIGVVRDREGNGVAIHRTYLKSGGKADVPAPRKMSQACGTLLGCAIQLYPAGKTLGIAEGIETACSAHELFGIPVWSCISATLLESFVPPAGVEKLIVFGDADANHAGQKAAYVLANRMALKGLDVSVRIPETMGRDWNDVARERVTA